MKSASLHLAASLFLLTGLTCLAQSPEVIQRPPDGGTREMLLSILIPSIPSAPFTGTVRTEWIRTLGDGSKITLKNHRLVARDSSGRIFQERRLLVPDETKDESPITQTEISDPVAHELYICVPQQLVCQLEIYSPAGGEHVASRAEFVKSQSASAGEDLGTQFIGGLEALGKRKTFTIEMGRIGNDHALTAKWEFWYSPTLGLNLISKRDDPRSGTQNFEVTDINLNEPDPKLFQVPAGSKVIDLRHEGNITPTGTPQ